MIWGKLYHPGSDSKSVPPFGPKHPWRVVQKFKNMTKSEKNYQNDSKNSKTQRFVSFKTKKDTWPWVVQNWKKLSFENENPQKHMIRTAFCTTLIHWSFLHHLFSMRVVQNLWIFLWAGFPPWGPPCSKIATPKNQTGQKFQPLDLTPENLHKFKKPKYPPMKRGEWVREREREREREI